MSTVNLGKIAFSNKGVYSGATTYYAQDVVTQNGDSYVCLVDGTVGFSPAATPAKWQLFAQGTAGVSTSAGEIIYNNGTALAALPAGTAGQVLTINSSGMPSWGTPDVRAGVKALKLIDNKNHNTVAPYRKFGCVMTDGSVRMWGNNDNYMLGDGTANHRVNPVAAAFPPGFVGVAQMYISYNYSSYVIDKNGQLWTWGYNGYGQLGLNDTTDRKVPVNASLISGSSLAGKVVQDVAVPGGTEGYASVIVWCTDGTAHACGYNGYGQLGVGDTTQRNIFTQVPVLANVTKVRMGRERYTASYAVTSDGKLYTWGYNGDNNLGDGGSSQSNIPVQRTGGTLSGKTIVNVYPQAYACHALASDGTLHGWGSNATYGNLGNGNFTAQATPVLCFTDVAAVYPNTYDYPFVLAKKTDGTLWGVGAGNYYANGNAAGNHSSTWAQIPIGSTVSKVAVGGTGSYNYCYALLTDGTVYSWGYNGNGALGLGHTNATWPPQKVPIAIRTVTDVCTYGTSSEQNGAFLMDDGSVYVCGYGGNYANADVTTNYTATFNPLIL